MRVFGRVMMTMLAAVVIGGALAGCGGNGKSYDEATVRALEGNTWTVRSISPNGGAEFACPGSFTFPNGEKVSCSYADTLDFEFGVYLLTTRQDDGTLAITRGLTATSTDEIEFKETASGTDTNRNGTVEESEVELNEPVIVRNATIISLTPNELRLRMPVGTSNSNEAMLIFTR